VARLDWHVLYLNARAWEIQPGEFWEMTMAEWFAEYEWRNDGNEYAGTLTHADVERLQKVAEHGFT